ncbi:MAG TPA: phosphotransferase [Woeseiaceae bacterium]
MNGTVPSVEAFAEAARAALGRWDLGDAKLALFAHRENAVFKVDTGDASYALRVHRPGYHDDAALASELAWMRALAQAGVEVPAIVPAADGELFVKVRADGIAAPVQVDLIEWIDGEPLAVGARHGKAAEAGWVRDQWGRLGALAAALHEHSAGWQPPAGFVRHAWDEHGLAGPDPLWGRFWELPALDAGQRALLLEARDRLFRELAALPKSRDAYGLIHADLLPENVLVCGERLRVIDFDDCGYGWHLFEIVTALYAVEGEPWYAEACDAFIEGYRTRRPLDDAALARLPLFFLARVLTDVGWMHTRAETENARRSTAARVASACALAEDYLRA